MVHVCFSYDEDSRKWECFVGGVASELEAKQAFNAVLLTCDKKTVSLLHLVIASDNGFYQIIPAVEVPE